jgi:hypothetical protein
MKLFETPQLTSPVLCGSDLDDRIYAQCRCDPGSAFLTLDNCMKARDHVDHVVERDGGVASRNELE